MTAKNIKENIYNFIVSCIDNGFCPSTREIAAELDIKSTSTIHRYILQLQNENRIIFKSGKKRSIRLPGIMSKNVPLIGMVAAGIPITAIENIEGYIKVSGINKDHLFALHIRGDSMKNAGILNNDIVVVEKTCYAENGDIVIALIGDEATAKRFFKKNGKLILHAENEDYEDIISDDITILGKVLSSIRYY